MTTHIFTVTKNTFKTHLKYKFAGTGFNPQDDKKDTGGIHPGAAEDILCCKKGDKIIFYVMGVGFYGFFKIISDPFFDKNGLTYYDELDGKKLPYRVLFEIDDEYGLYQTPSGEWDTTDDLSFIKNPNIHDIQWNWLYKKLSGNRGCLHIFDWEADNIKKSLKRFNDKNDIFFGNSQLDYSEDNIILAKNKKIENYKNKLSKLTISDCNIESEHGLEVYIIEENIEDILGSNLTFLGPQTKCSLGERAIDILTISENKNWRVIELKNINLTPKNIENVIIQIERYIRWAYSRYEKKIAKLIPVIVFKEGLKKQKKNGDFTENYKKIIKIVYENNKNFVKIYGTQDVKVYEYHVETLNVKFKEFDYKTKI